MKRMLLATFFLILTMVIMSAQKISACFSPTDFFAVEVLLNNPGATYNIDPIMNATNVSMVDNSFVYRSHFDGRVAIILDEIDEPSVTELKGLSVRIQIPTKVIIIDGQADLVEAMDVSKDTFDFKSAMKIELDWLEHNGIIGGVDGNDLAQIVENSEAGNAGWNSRIVFDQKMKKWLPYDISSNPSLIRNADCGGFSISNLEYEGEIILPDLMEPSSVNMVGKIAIRWGLLKISG